MIDFKISIHKINMALHYVVKISYIYIILSVKPVSLRRRTNQFPKITHQDKRTHDNIISFSFPYSYIRYVTGRGHVGGDIRTNLTKSLGSRGIPRTVWCDPRPCHHSLLGQCPYIQFRSSSTIYKRLCHNLILVTKLFTNANITLEIVWVNWTDVCQSL